jgi:hypothetical protein
MVFAKDKTQIPKEAYGFKGVVSAKVISKSNISMTIAIMAEEIKQTQESKRLRLDSGKV